MEDERIDFRSLLKALRIRKGPTWKQPVMADALGFSHRLYVAWETGESIPSGKKLRRIADYFKLNKEEEEELYRAAAQAPPRIHNLPFLKNPFFTGRKTHLEQLGKLLQETGTVEITQAVSISGLGGIGKTQLALEYAHRNYPKVYLTVLWVNAADSTTLQESYDSVAHTLELPESNENDPMVRIQAVKRWLEEHTSWLLVMDNADDLQLAHSFLPVKPLGHSILTTRSQIVRDSNIAAQIIVGIMEPEEGATMLLRRSGLLLPSDEFSSVTGPIRAIALQLVELLGAHPLALNQAGAYIEATGMKLDDYVELYKRERGALLDLRGPPRANQSDHPESVATTLQLSFRKACERQARVADVLYFCSFLQPDVMPEELFYQESDFNLDLRSFNDVMVALRRYSLVSRNSEKRLFSMHRLVQAVIREQISPDLRKQWRGRVVRTVNATFPEVDFKNWRQCGRLLPHARVCAAWTEEELTPTQEFSELLGKAAIYLQERGRYGESERLLLRVLQFWDTQLGADHPTAAAAAHRLAQLCKKQRRYDLAESLYRQVLPIYEKHLGIGHPDMASALSELGLLYAYRHRYKNAISLIGLAILTQSHQLGENHPTTLRSISDMARIYTEQGKYDIAVSIYKQALSAQKESLGIDHPETANTMRELGNVYVLKGEYELAEPLLRQWAMFCEEYLGENHPDRMRAVIDMAFLYYHQERYQWSETLYEWALAEYEYRFGAKHLDTAHVLFGLTAVLHQQRKYERAEDLYRRAICIYEQQLGVTHQNTQAAKKSYANLLHAMHRHTEAAALELTDDPQCDVNEDVLDNDSAHYMGLMLRYTSVHKDFLGRNRKN